MTDHEVVVASVALAWVVVPWVVSAPSKIEPATNEPAAMSPAWVLTRWLAAGVKEPLMTPGFVDVNRLWPFLSVGTTGLVIAPAWTGDATGSAAFVPLIYRFLTLLFSR